MAADISVTTVVSGSTSSRTLAAALGVSSLKARLVRLINLGTNGTIYYRSADGITSVTSSNGLPLLAGTATTPGGDSGFVPVHGGDLANVYIIHANASDNIGIHYIA